MKTLSQKQLYNMANTLRKHVISMLVEAGSGHSAGPLDLAEVFSVLYFHSMKHNPKKPDWEERDRLFLSCGHNAPIRYAAMIESGYLPKKYLKTLRKLGSPLQGHPSYHNWPAVEHSSGPLGQGTSLAVGSAIASKMDGRNNWVYCVTGDGEHNEGQVWEALMLAGKLKLNNLIFFIDRNNIQIDGYTEEVMPLEPIKDKYEAFNWHVIEVDGHNVEHLVDAINTSKAIYEKPKLILCHTIPGKGVDFMEYKPEWHGKPPKIDEAASAMKQLRSLDGKILTEYE